MEAIMHIGQMGPQIDGMEIEHIHSIKEFAVVKRSVMVGNHKTSVSLENAFWVSLKDIAAQRGLTLSSQVEIIDRNRKTNNLSSAIRLFVLDHFQNRAIHTVYVGARQNSPNIALVK
jgi:predicted DNA-binding ribbon-helix-helix protein